MKILYIRKSYNNPLDGGDVYNQKLVEGLSACGHVVKEIALTNTNKSWVFPVWKWRLDDASIGEIINDAQLCDKVIVSHESLVDLVKHLKIDLFIFQNLFSVMEGSKLSLRLIYRFKARSLENTVCRSVKKVLVLSSREEIHLANRFKNVFCVPPGVNISLRCVEDIGTIGLERNQGWRLKSRSNYSLEELKVVFQNFKFVENLGAITRIVLIEDDFKLGFKLKLIQGLYTGDIVFSRLDHREEIEALGLNSDNFYLIGRQSFKVEEITNMVNTESLIRNRSIISENYTWDRIAQRILSTLW